MVKLLLLIIKMFSILKGPCNKQFHRNCVSQHLRQRVLPQGPMATVVLAHGSGSVDISQGQPKNGVVLVLAVIQKNVVCHLICFCFLADQTTFSL